MSTTKIIAAAVCAAEILIYATIGALLGWRNGGGVIPMAILFAVVVATWTAITSQKSQPPAKPTSPGIPPGRWTGDVKVEQEPPAVAVGPEPAPPSKKARTLEQENARAARFAGIFIVVLLAIVLGMPLVVVAIASLIGR